MRKYPYVVVTGFTPATGFLVKALADLEIPNFAEKNIQPGENRAERLRTELEAADVVLVVPGSPEVFSEDIDSEAVKSRKSKDPAFKVIPVRSNLESGPTLPDWLKDVKPLFYDPNNPSGTIAAIANSLIPDVEAPRELTLDELLAEAEALKLRLQFIEDQYRHSLLLLGVSSLVFAAGFLTVIYAVRAGAGSPLSGFFQFFGLVMLVVGGFSLFFSILNWSSQYKRSRLARRVKKSGLVVIDKTKKFLGVADDETDTSTRPY
ncbi:MAG TPA: hypothetical protein VGW76_17830 [Pyrinomonadaceae bacterium]|nr:hypothetical protein [Pyrinomonadaceae bacterium]